MKRTTTLRLAALASLFALCSCQGLSTVDVVADRAFLDAVSPEYLAYVDADPALLPEQKRIRHNTVERYREVIVAREGALKR